MSFPHYWTICRHFQGTAAERLVVITYALSIKVDPERKTTNGRTHPLLSIHEVAARCGMHARNVRAIVRRLEGRTPGVTEPGKWLYPLAGEAHQGDGKAKVYWMPLEAPPALPEAPKIVRNPTGKGATKGRRPSSGEVRQTSPEGEVQQTSPSTGPGFAEPPRGGSTNLPGGGSPNRHMYSFNESSYGGGSPPPRPTPLPGETSMEFIQRVRDEHAKMKAGQAPPLHSPPVGGIEDTQPEKQKAIAS